MALVDTGLVVRYYVDEAASGQGPTQVDDAAAVPFNLALVYGGTNLNYTEIGGNRGLECTNIDGDQKASGNISDTSDKIRDNIHGAQKFTVEIVVRVDNFHANAGRCFVINHSSSASSTLGLEGFSATQARTRFNGTLMRTWDPGTVRAVWHIVVDTTQATANDRIKIYKNGVLQSPTVEANPALNATISISAGSELIMFNRGPTPRDRSMDGVLFYGALYSVAMPQADITTNFDILTADDDTPAGGETPVSQTAESDYEGLGGLSPSEQKAFESLINVSREL